MYDYNELIKKMTYKEFKEFCNQRACDGKWTGAQFLGYSELMKSINNIEVKIFGFVFKKKTEEIQEKFWQIITKY